MLLQARAPLPDIFAGMNGYEKMHAQRLEALKRTGQIAAWWFESFTFRLATRTTYTPDFIVQENDGSLRAEEVKGSFWRDDARVKIKAFAALYPIPIKAYALKKGAWIVETF